MMVPVLVWLFAVPVQEPMPQDVAPYALRGLPKRIVHDVARLGTPPPLIALGVGGALALVTHPADQASVKTMSGSEAIDETFDAGSLAGNLQPVAAVVVYAIGGLKHSPAVVEVGSALVEAQVVNGILTQVIKVAVDRTRPNGGSHSFPSGHTSATFATADVLEQRFGWKVGLPAYLGGIYVGAARMAERQHYLSDVVFGAAVGIASSRTAQIRTKHGTIAAYPAFTKGGAEIVFTVH